MERYQLGIAATLTGTRYEAQKLADALEEALENAVMDDRTRLHKMAVRVRGGFTVEVLRPKRVKEEAKT